MQSSLEKQSSSKKHTFTLAGSSDGHKEDCRIPNGSAAAGGLRCKAEADTAPNRQDSMTFKDDTTKVLCLLKSVHDTCEIV